jgi:hypothetical protein
LVLDRFVHQRGLLHRSHQAVIVGFVRVAREFKACLANFAFVHFVNHLSKGQELVEKLKGILVVVLLLLVVGSHRKVGREVDLLIEAKHLA